MTAASQTPMPTSTLTRKRVALVAHDNRKRDLAEWASYNYGTLALHELICTGTTGKMIEGVLRTQLDAHGLPGTQVDVTLLKSGPLGGDQQLGALIAEGRIDLVVFYWDPLAPHPHDVDVKALLRIAVVYNVPIACNRSTADFVISSPLMGVTYHPAQDDFSGYTERPIGVAG